MPIYEYRCAKCGDFDVMQKITEKPLRKCPTCKGKVSKLVSNTSFQLKGSGWYLTDYAGKGGTKGDGGAKDGAKADASSDKSEKSPKADGKAEKSSESPKKGKPKGSGAADAA
jgi:putative FmdB family regulatory protein